MLVSMTPISAFQITVWI